MYYSPILFAQVADLNLTQYHNCNYSIENLNSKERILIFCLINEEYLKKLHYFLDNVKKPFILITAMEDTEFPSDINKDFINKVISNNYFKHWFTVNKTIPNTLAFTSIPYGLDFWTITNKPYFGENIQTIKKQNYILENIINESEPFHKRIPKIYGNFHFNFSDDRYDKGRRKLLNIIPRNIIEYENKRLPRQQCWKKMSQYTFIICPFGHGYDCIRTFEALCLGCIVIKKTNFLDIIYEELPVLLVNDWNDINEELLKQTLLDYKNKTFNYNKLKFKYWSDLINLKF